MAMSAESTLSAPQTIEVARPAPKAETADALRRIAAATGRSHGSLMRDFMRVSMGPGKLRFDEYVALGLYDPDRFAGSDIRSFAGLSAMQKIWNWANFRIDLYGLLSNKIAMSAVLAAHGLPAIPITAVFSKAGGSRNPLALHDRDGLLAFLRNPANYPIFGKPMDGFQSLGSASFERYDASTDHLVTSSGATHSVEAYAGDIIVHYATGYLFQPRQSPHSATHAICGERLPTVRVLTLHGKDGPKILRACEKMPAGDNVADNYWRDGNLLVQLDLETGQRGRAISGTGLDLTEHTTHPGSGAAIAGTHVPNWSEVCGVALEGASMLSETPLIGWDIASGEDGAVIVEVNCTPDLILPQMADRRGMLDAEFNAFIAERRIGQKAWLRDVRAYNRSKR